jgi:hypothetical protein
MYKLYSDKSKKFTCNIDITGASLKECEARLVLETNSVNLLYYGKIDSNGLCEVEIDKLKDLLPENTKGKLKLEVIADKQFFTAWESKFVVEQQKTVKITEMVDNDSFVNTTKKVSVIVEDDDLSDDLIFENTDKVNKQIEILERQIITKNIKDGKKFNQIFEYYSDIIKEKKLLSETEMKKIKNILIAKHNF